MYRSKRPTKKLVDIENIFIEVYSAYPASVMGREDIDLSNNIILPPSTLEQLSLMKNFGDTKNPILFRIMNIQLNCYTHCGVAEFTAKNGTCYLPKNMFERLCLEEGQQVNLRSINLDQGTFIKLQPHETEFINNPEPRIIFKNILNFNLRNYFCVTEGDTISVNFSGKIYKIDVIECKPEKQIRILNCEIIVDFAPPKDYKEPELKDDNVTGSNIKFKNDQEHEQQKKKQGNKYQIKNFLDIIFRIDGKNVSNTQAIRIINAKKEQKDNEDN